MSTILALDIGTEFVKAVLAKPSKKGSSCLLSTWVFELHDLKTSWQTEEIKVKGSVWKQRRYKSLVSGKSLMKPQLFKGN